MKKNYNLLLLSPKQKHINYQAHSELAKIFGKKRLMIPLALPTIAALTPDNYKIKIIDEEIESIPKNYKPDIFGITTLSATSQRAFKLGDIFRSQEITVVFGGPYISYNVEEGLKHADSIVIGEAENSWENCLQDFENGQIKQTYISETKCEFKIQKSPRWDIVSTNKIFQCAVQATRGCPFNCDFCLVSEMFGRKMRFRDIDNVIEEVKALPLKWVFFIDDNFTINKEYAHKLMKRLKPLGISWACQASIDVANDDELLKEMADAGCFNILIGFESLNPSSLSEMHKTHNKKAKIYKDAIKKIHKYGIQINASFIVGFDNDTLFEFDNIFNFTLETGMAYVNLHTLSAVYGTQLHSKLKKENRLTDLSPELGVGFLPNMEYINFSRLELFDKYMETLIRLFSWDTLNKKATIYFNGGNFTKPGADINFLMKFKLSMIIFFEFIISKDKNKRKIFHNILSMIKQNKIAIDKGFAFLIYMLGINRHIKKHLLKIDEYRELIK